MKRTVQESANFSCRRRVAWFFWLRQINGFELPEPVIRTRLRQNLSLAKRGQFLPRRSRDKKLIAFSNEEMHAVLLHEAKKTGTKNA